MAAASRHIGDWLVPLPIAFCGLKLDDVAVRVAVVSRLGPSLCIPHIVNVERKSMPAAPTVMSANRHRAKHLGTTP